MNSGGSNPSHSHRAPLSVFFAYAPADELFCRKLETHLTLLARLNIIGEWHDHNIAAGRDISQTLREQIHKAGLILLLVSADFMASDTCYTEMLSLALERHAAKHAMVIPILLRPVDHWKAAPFGKLQPLPKNGRFVSEWSDQDDALRAISEGIREAIDHQSPQKPAPPHTRYPDAATRLRSQELHLAYSRRDVLQLHGLSTADVDQEILKLKRALRESGQPKPGLLLDEGRYLLTEKVGSGGFASVWKAFDTRQKLDVAIKILHANLAGDEQKRERFFRGARLMAELVHPHIVQVLDAKVEDEGWYFFVMEYMHGGNLRDAVLTGKVLGERALDIMGKVIYAVAVAHRRGIVHRDIKPANILLDEHGSPKLSDFDLVAAPGTTGGTKGGMMGSFIYAAPELLDTPEEADARADVFGLGMTLLFCLYGKDLPAKVFRDAEPTIKGLDCDESLKNVIRKAVDWEKENRHPTGGEMAIHLRVGVLLNREHAS